MMTSVSAKWIKPAEYNPRMIGKAELASLRRSIEEFGIVEPLVVRDDGLLIGGHQRFHVLCEMHGGVEFDVPVMIVNGLDDARTKVLNVALNKIQGEWDYEKLLTVLGDVDPALVEYSGFELSELNKLSEFLHSGSIYGQAALNATDDQLAADIAEASKEKMVFTMTILEKAKVERVLKTFDPDMNRALIKLVAKESGDG